MTTETTKVSTNEWQRRMYRRALILLSQTHAALYHELLEKADKQMADNGYVIDESLDY